MTGEEKEKVLDLLYDKFVYGLNDEEARELDHLGYDQRDAESIEKTIAALGLVDLDSATEMPASLTSKLLRDADDHFGADPANDVAAVRGSIGWAGRSQRRRVSPSRSHCLFRAVVRSLRANRRQRRPLKNG